MRGRLFSGCQTKKNSDKRYLESSYIYHAIEEADSEVSKIDILYLSKYRNISEEAAVFSMVQYV